jgi:hypothetical protein
VTGDEPADPHILAAGHAPTPFTADDLRRGCPAGRSIRLLTETAGAAAVHRLNVFVAADNAEATIERSQTRADGTPLGALVTDHVSWVDLQRHAMFPAAQTTIQTDLLDTPMGVLECLRYTVVADLQTTTLWFAVRAPGMPVKSVVSEHGKVVNTTTMVADSRLSSTA